MAVIEFLAVEGAYGAGLTAVEVDHFKELPHPLAMVLGFGEGGFGVRGALIEGFAEGFADEFLEVEAAGGGSGFHLTVEGIGEVDCGSHGVTMMLLCQTESGK